MKVNACQSYGGLDFETEEAIEVMELIAVINRYASKETKITITVGKEKENDD